MGNSNIKGCTSPNQDKKEGAGNKDQKNVPLPRSEKRNKKHESRINDSTDVYTLTNKTNHKGDSNKQSGDTDDTHMQSDEQFKTMEGTENNRKHPTNKSNLLSSKRKKYKNKHTESGDGRDLKKSKQDNSSQSKFYDEESLDETKLQQNCIKKDITKQEETSRQENTNTNEQQPVTDQRLKMVEDEISSLKNQVKELTELLKNQARMPRKVESVDSKLEVIGCIQILQRGDGDFLYEIMEYLREVLRSSLNNETIRPALEICKRPSDVKKGDPLLVVCISSSRVVEDAEKAIKDVQELERAMLLIFHMKEKHVLPVPNSKPQLTGQSFNNLGGALDFAFTSEQGVYSCEMNESSKTKMIRFIKNLLVECTRF